MKRTNSFLKLTSTFTASPTSSEKGTKVSWISRAFTEVFSKQESIFLLGFAFWLFFVSVACVFFWQNQTISSWRILGRGCKYQKKGKLFFFPFFIF